MVLTDHGVQRFRARANNCLVHTLVCTTPSKSLMPLDRTFTRGYGDTTYAPPQCY